MSKIIDITEKLNFEDRPIIKVKDIEIEANNDAVTMLKVIALFDNDKKEKGMNVADILSAYTLLFDEDNQKKVENLNLSMTDFTTLIIESAGLLINGEDTTQGETKTPAMI